MRSITKLACICLLISFFVLIGCNKVTKEVNEIELEITASPTITEKEEPLILVESKGESIVPYVNCKWSSTWTDNGWFDADGIALIYLLPDWVNELPVLIYSEDFSVQYKKDVSFYLLSIYSESFQRIQNNVDLSYLDELSDGTYYISIEVIEQGKYIEEEKLHELRGYECVFKLVVN